jgi:hypothetical protein
MLSHLAADNPAPNWIPSSASDMYIGPVHIDLRRLLRMPLAKWLIPEQPSANAQQVNVIDAENTPRPGDPSEPANPTNAGASKQKNLLTCCSNKSLVRGWMWLRGFVRQNALVVSWVVGRRTVTMLKASELVDARTC